MQTGGPELSAAFVPRSNLVVSAGQDGTLDVLRPPAVSAPAVPGAFPSFAPTGQTVVSGGPDAVYLWDLASGGQRRLPATDGSSAAAFSPDGREIVSVGLNATNAKVDVYDQSTGRTRQLPFPAFTRGAVAISATGKIAVGGNNVAGNQAVYVENVDGTGRVALRGHTEAVTALAFSPDGTRLASASADGTVRVWKVRSARVEHVIAVDAAGVRDVSFGRHGTRLATADSDGTVGVWPVTGAHPVFLVGHVGPVNTARFNAAGDRIVSTGQDGTVRVWSAAGGETLVVLRQAAGGASDAAAVSPDGSSVVSHGVDGMFITPCEVCGSFTQVRRIAATRAAPILSAGELGRLANPATPG
jgi:WD40 repeat protein